MRQRSDERRRFERLVLRLHAPVAQSAASAGLVSDPPSARASPHPANDSRKPGGRRERQVEVERRVSLLQADAVRQTALEMSSNAQQDPAAVEKRTTSLSRSSFSLAFASTALVG